MDNEFRGTGVVGSGPALASYPLRGRWAQVIQLRVRFAAAASTGLAGQEAPGFWLDVNVHGGEHSRVIASQLRRGTRVYLVGHLVESRWRVTATGEERRVLVLDADEIYLVLPLTTEARV